MGFNTDQFSKAVSVAKSKKGDLARLTYRGLSVGALVYLFATFAQVKDVNQLREWVKALSIARTVEVNEIDHRLDMLERNAAYLNGHLGFPVVDFGAQLTNDITRS